MKVLLVSERAETINDPVFRVLESRGVVFHRIALSELRLEGGSRLARKRRRYFPDRNITGPVAEAVATFGPDLVHAGAGRPVGLAVVKALRDHQKVPVIFDHGAIGGLNLFNPFDWMTYFNRRIDKLVVPSHAMVNNWMGQAWLRRCISAERCAVLHHAIEQPAQADPRDREALRSGFGLRPDEFVIGTVCTIRPIKNLPFLADAVRRLGPPFVFAVIGPAGDAAELQRLRDAGGDRLRLLGLVPRARTVMAAFDLYATPTGLPGESFGLAAVEAMSQSLPVLTMNFGGSAEIVEHNVAGLTLPPDAGHWMQAITALAAEPERCRQMGEAGRRRAAARFSPEAIAADCLALYRSVARGPDGRA
ncbi:glycosyltransferase family 4 protein [Mesorhizobium sp. L-8-3]|uniref:glycosyltransferase family 4 protein n=1 Tax=Mesorhizobium sp. L-8-3 TaxID=2744522 RepID=UPI00192825C9|nr:glycosyltransferase family 4 protein [Mesorhizobium sp. L-8-3]BCH22266.1 N-acetyl-alpha-D-glucosaminyl L-malate synthase BshA [Mesorhizobium sp. L-8-3]